MWDPFLKFGVHFPFLKFEVRLPSECLFCCIVFSWARRDLWFHVCLFVCLVSLPWCMYDKSEWFHVCLCQSTYSRVCASVCVYFCDAMGGESPPQGGEKGVAVCVWYGMTCLFLVPRSPHETVTGLNLLTRLIAMTSGLVYSTSHLFTSHCLAVWSEAID